MIQFLNPQARSVFHHRMRFTSCATIFALLLSLLVATGCQSAARRSAPASMFVYIGTYTSKASKGIYRSRLDLATGALSQPELVAESANPSYLAVHPNQKFLYAINETGSGAKAGAVSAFAIDAKTGGLTALNQQTAGGAGPCHLVVDGAGKNVLLANYGGGSIESVPIKADGSLAEPVTFIQQTDDSGKPGRPREPRAHCIVTDVANRFAYVCYLGLDKVMIYKFDSAGGTLVPNDPPWSTLKPGAGPRHLSLHPSGRFAYVINESDSTLTAFACDPATGALKEIETHPTLPAPVPGNSTAEIEVHPSGKFVYGSNRGHDSIVVFAIDPSTGKLTFVEHQTTLGKTPRNFAIDPGGTFLLAANQDSDNVVVFRIDQKTGKLTPTGHTIQVGAPVALEFVPIK